MTTFNTIPAVIDVPGFYLEINSLSSESAASPLQGAVLIGVSNEFNSNNVSTDAVTGRLIPVSTANQAASLYGRGSQIHGMVKAFRNNDPFGPLHCIGLDNSSGTAASETVYISTPTDGASASGRFVTYIGGQRYVASVGYEETASQIAAKLIKTINARQDGTVKAESGDSELLRLLSITTTDNTTFVFKFSDEVAIEGTPTDEYPIFGSPAISGSTFSIAVPGTDKTTIEITYNALQSDAIQFGSNFSNTIFIHQSSAIGKVLTGFAGFDSTYSLNEEPSIKITSKWRGTQGESISIAVGINPAESLPGEVELWTTEDKSSGQITPDVPAYLKSGSGEVSTILTDSITDLLLEHPMLLLVPPISTFQVPVINSLRTTMAARWGFQTQTYGHIIGATTEDFPIGTIDQKTQSAEDSVVFCGETPTPSWECAAAIAGAIIGQVRASPHLPVTGSIVNGIIPPPATDITYNNRTELLANDWSTINVTNGVVTVERLVSSDPYWTDFSRRMLMAAISTFIKGRIAPVTRNVAIADDGTLARPGSGVVTPSQIKNAIEGSLQQLSLRGWIETYNVNEISVERDFDDPGRANISVFINPTNALYIIAARVDAGE